MARDMQNPDLISRLLNLFGQFRGKARLSDFLGRLSCFVNDGHGVFRLTDGKTVAVDLKDRIQRLMWGGAYEPHVTRCLAILLRPGDTFLDVGAHIGFFSLVASSLVGPSGRVYAFEANPSIFPILQSNASPYPWLLPQMKAIWKESCSLAFSDPEQAGESGWGKLGAIRYEGHIEQIQAIALDEWYEEVNSPEIRLIKIDAEGAEPYILEGARRILANARPFLIVEMNDVLLSEGGRSRANVDDALRRHDYRAFAIQSKVIEEIRDVPSSSHSEILCVPMDRIEEAWAAVFRPCREDERQGQKSGHLRSPRARGSELSRCWQAR